MSIRTRAAPARHALIGTRRLLSNEPGISRPYVAAMMRREAIRAASAHTIRLLWTRRGLGIGGDQVKASDDGRQAPIAGAGGI